MFIQKAYKNGNSVVVTIPKEYLRDLNIRDGSELVVEKDDNTRVLTVTKKKKAKGKREGVNKEFKQWWDTFLKENSEILDELAVR